MRACVRLFDVYRGPNLAAGKKSLAYAPTYQADDKTLTDKEVSKVHSKIVGRLEKVRWEHSCGRDRGSARGTRLARVLMQRVVIVGAGISGLATAFHLQARLPTADITVLESGPRPGGTIWTERREGFQVELGANGFLDTNPSTVVLCERLGLGPQLLSANDAAKNRYLFWQERLQPLPGSFWAFLRSPLLSWRGKIDPADRTLSLSSNGW